MAKIGSFKFWAIIAVLVAIFLPPFARYQELRYKNRKLSEEIKQLSAESKRLAEEKRRLETDIGYIEKTARDRMGVVRKGEIVLKGSHPKK